MTTLLTATSHRAELGSRPTRSGRESLARLLSGLWALLVAVSALGPGLAAQEENQFGNIFGGGGFGAGEPKLRAEVEALPNPINPGSYVEVRITLDVDSEFHVYGSANPSEIGAPIAVSFDETQGLIPVGDPVIPPGTKHGEGELSTWWLQTGAVLTQVFQVPNDLDAGDLLVTGVLDYSPCDHTTCLPPEKVPFDVSVTIDPDAYVEDIGWEVSVDPAPARAGEVVEVTVSGLVQNGYHLYGAADPNPARLIPTPDALPSWPALGETVKPTGELHIVEGDGPHDWVLGPFTFKRRFEIPGGVAAGETTVPVSFSFMLCDKLTCLRPEVVALEATVQIQDGAPRPEFTRDAALAALANADDASGEGDGDEDKGLLATLLLGLSAGLIALLMPCTYPMIPITISVFSKRAQSPGARWACRSPTASASS